MQTFDFDSSGEDVAAAQQTSSMSGSRVKKAVGVAAVLLGIVAIAATTGAHFSQTCGNLGALQGKAQLDVDAVMRENRDKLVSIKNQTSADELIMKTMVKAGHDAARTWEKHHVRKLDTLQTISNVEAYYKKIGTRRALNAECAFNILESFVSIVGMGDDINGIIRVCPAPRHGESELACQVDSSILVAWVGNLATKLALAASNCALSLNVDAVCSVGVTGLVSAFGEIAAGACLAAATCTGTPPQLTTTKISELGDQTIRGRRLLIGQGPVGNGVQCAVDVGMVTANIANMGIAINKAVNINNCKKSTFRTPLNVLKGIPEAVCTVDIGGAVAYIGQVVTFVNLIVVHCQDFLDVNALCAGSIAAITTGSAAIAPYAAAVHAGCRYNHLLKTPKAVGQINALWNVPSWDLPPPTTRRLEDEKQPSLKESLARIAQTKELVKDLGVNMTRRGESQANMETLLNLMGGLDKEKEAPRAAWPFQEC